MHFMPLDIAFFLFAAIIILRAALHGFVDEVMNIAWLVAGTVFAISFYKPAALVMRERFLGDIKILPEVLGFVALFLLVFIAVKLITFMLNDIISRISLSGLDHFLGFLFGMVEALALICALLFLIKTQPLFDPAKILEGSFFYANLTIFGI
ncbi:MAG: hypothetical protein Ta2G_08200 [Termitinemataceae bacterium]|nr:MAG: hypothetical protein Ta2G_08200 [Termitinemataceae bacterium]